MSSNFQTIAVERRLIDKLLIKEMVFVLVFSVLLQVLIHLIPSGNVPAGAYLLPLFYAPFIAVLFFRLQVGIVVALLSPLCNYLITGNPVPELLGVITIELVAFVLLSNWQQVCLRVRSKNNSSIPWLYKRRKSNRTKYVLLFRLYFGR